MESNLFKDKTILVTGGTGSIGSGILEFLIKLDCKKIIIFSRDEYKQHKLRYKYSENKNIEYILGDVRDLEALNFACHGVDIIFHCAALKHVPISEEMPEEFIKTNILGSLNIKKASLNNKIPLVVSISTDKAANPSNVMGLTKAIQEKIFSSYSLQGSNSIKFVNVRFGNVIGTAGSFFPIIYHQIKNKIPITITDPDMTRFFMSKKEAIDLIFWAAENGTNGSSVIRRMKAAKIGDIVNGFLEVMKEKEDYPVKTIGARIGEKKHEILVSEDEALRIKGIGNYFVIAPYGKREITNNLIKGGQIFNESQIGKFVSSTEGNRLNMREIGSYIREYIKAQTENQYI
jgi:UDP-N-acetylglucosamine 4,6-dehydratase/5-epimerase